VFPHGGITLAHAAVLVLLPVIVRGLRGLRPVIWVLWLLALWVFAIVLTAAQVGGTVWQIGFAVARPVSLTLSFCVGIWVFRQGTRAVRAFLVALVAGMCVGTVLYHSVGFVAEPWKYGLGSVLSFGAVLLSAHLIPRMKRSIALLPLLAVGLVSLFTGSRAEFMVVTVALAMTMLCGRRISVSSLGIVWAGGALAVLVLGLYAGYGTLAAGGALGKEQQLRWTQQAGREGGALMGARPEVLGSLGLIAESPLLGRGVAAPPVDLENRTAFLERIRGSGAPIHEGMERYYFGHGLYLHSVLFQLWAEAGPLTLPGLLLPVGLVLYAVRVAVRHGSRPLVLIYSFLAAHVLWDLLFSPWPRLQGTYLGIAAAAAVVYLVNRPDAPLPAPHPMKGSRG
jgi:hypothetical protein